MLSPAEEIYFWLGIMRDHAEFILTSLSPRETQLIIMAQNYKNNFTALRSQAKGLTETKDINALMQFVNNIIAVLTSFISFKRLILRKLLECKIEINLPPTFINHMINEALDFYRTLCMIQSCIPLNTVQEDIRLHKIWLPDASGHAAFIACSLDPTEEMLIKEAEGYKKTFNQLFIKTTELGLMLERACLEDGALENLNEEAMREISSFICFLDKILKLRSECKALGFASPLVPDHMIREERYYLSKLQSIGR